MKKNSRSDAIQRENQTVLVDLGKDIGFNDVKDGKLLEDSQQRNDFIYLKILKLLYTP